MVKLLFSVLVSCAVATASAVELPRNLGAMTSNKPAFLYVLPTSPGSDPSLLIASFQAFGRDEVRRISNVSAYLTQFPAARESVLTSSITWPNGIHAMPAALSSGDHLMIAGGFLVPGKGTGAISVLNTRDNTVKKITKDKSGWFYHRVAWLDMNGDGRDDIVTARANKPLFGSAKGELIWLKQPTTNPLTSTWVETVLKTGPDVHFELVDLNDDGAIELVATEFFSKKLSLHWFEAGVMRSRVLDATLGAGFDVAVHDLNHDGRRDLLVTNHESTASKAAVFSYEIPSDIKTGTFVRHTLLTNIQTRNSGQNQASPGTAFAFYPRTNDHSKKPYIVVAGDGSQRVHLLAPMSEQVDDWRYSEHILLDVGGTVGQLAVADVNGDGFTEIFVPAYDGNKIHAFSYAP